MHGRGGGAPARTLLPAPRRSPASPQAAPAAGRRRSEVAEGADEVVPEGETGVEANAEPSAYGWASSGTAASRRAPGRARRPGAGRAGGRGRAHQPGAGPRRRGADHGVSRCRDSPPRARRDLDGRRTGPDEVRYTLYAARRRHPDPAILLFWADRGALRRSTVLRLPLAGRTDLSMTPNRAPASGAGGRPALRAQARRRARATPTCRWRCRPARTRPRVIEAGGSTKTVATPLQPPPPLLALSPVASAEAAAPLRGWRAARGAGQADVFGASRSSPDGAPGGPPPSRTGPCSLPPVRPTFPELCPLPSGRWTAGTTSARWRWRSSATAPQAPPPPPSSSHPGCSLGGSFGGGGDLRLQGAVDLSRFLPAAGTAFPPPVAGGRAPRAVISTQVGGLGQFDSRLLDVLPAGGGALPGLPLGAAAFHVRAGGGPLLLVPPAALRAPLRTGRQQGASAERLRRGAGVSHQLGPLERLPRGDQVGSPAR